MDVMTRISCMMQVNTTDYDAVVAGLQFGLMDWQSTVSTFAAEFNAMKESEIK